METLTGIVRAIVVAIDGRLPATDVQNAWSLVEAGEPGFALENLCTQVNELEIPIPSEGIFGSLFDWSPHPALR